MVIEEVSVYRWMLIVVFACVESQGEAPPSTELYFTLNGTVYLSGDTILINDIGSGLLVTTNPFTSPTTMVTTMETTMETTMVTTMVTTMETTMVTIMLTTPTTSPTTSPTPTPTPTPTPPTTTPTPPTTPPPPTLPPTTTPPETPPTTLSPATPSLIESTAAITPVTEKKTIPSTNVVRTTTMTTPTTKMTTLTVMVVSNGNVLSAGQNHILECKVSRGESMAYTYMWLKDGSVVSGQTSSTYSFTSLEVADSGRYSCQVRVGSMTITSEGVDITVLAITEDGGDVFIVVMVVALVMVLALILIIILLIILVLKKHQTKKNESVELHTYDTVHQGGAYEAIDNTKKADGIYSEITSPSTTDATNSQSKVEEFALSQCPAYGPLPHHQQSENQR